MFNNIFTHKKSTSSDYSTQINNPPEKNLALQATLETWKQKQKIIQSQFDFIIPNYIIDEIIDLEMCKNYSNLHSLLFLAVDNKRLSKEQALLIKQIYC